MGVPRPTQGVRFYETLLKCRGYEITGFNIGYLTTWLLDYLTG